MSQGVGTIPPCPPVESKLHSEVLWAMKQRSQQLDQWWRKTRDESDWTLDRAHLRAYAVALMALQQEKVPFSCH